ncbi:MAG: phosphate acyltransferase [Planctomycetota bacterium]|nr:phosphate acyltransferase [Planctomycetota bacterium]
MTLAADAPPLDDRSELRTVSDLVHLAGRLSGMTVVVVGGDRREDLRLVESARDHGIVQRVLLIGNADGIARAVDEVGIDVAQEDILAAPTEEAAAAIAVDLIRSGAVDVVLKGSIATPVINRAMLPLARQRTVSLVTLFDAPPIADGRLLILTDAGVTTHCTFERMQDLIRNAVEVARTVLCLERPRVAILSANEKPIASLPSTKLAADLTALEWPQAVVYGPLSFDLATDPGSVAIKGLPHHPRAREVAGQADVLVCPGLDSANILYKAISALNKYGLASLANVTVGFPVPYIILSRADTLETRLESIALGSLLAQRQAVADPPPGTRHAARPQGDTKDA